MSFCDADLNNIENLSKDIQINRIFFNKEMKKKLNNTMKCDYWYCQQRGVLTQKSTKSKMIEII